MHYPAVVERRSIAVHYYVQLIMRWLIHTERLIDSLAEFFEEHEAISNTLIAVAIPFLSIAVFIVLSWVAYAGYLVGGGA